MKINFIHHANLSKALVGEVVSNDQKTVERFFAYQKPSRNPYNNQIRVMRQTINDTARGWLVTDMEVFDSRSGRVIKSLKREVDKHGNFDTILNYIDKNGKQQNKVTSHPVKK